MILNTGHPMLDLALSVLLDIRLHLVISAIMFTHLVLRQPKPRKGAGNKAILVTGCDSGIGHRIARRLDQMESIVFAGCLRPDGPGARSLREACSSRLHIVPLDVTDEKQVEEAVAYVKGHLPAGEKGLYCLINNAGILAYANFELMTTSLCQQVIDVNLMGAMRMTKYFLPLLRKVPGRIVTITSILARLTMPDTAVYAASKHALNGFFESLRKDLHGSGIHIATIEPGDFSRTTDIHQWTLDHLDEMWSSVNPEEREMKRALYENAKRRNQKEKLPPQKQEENYKYIIADAEHAVFAEEPSKRYVSAPFAHRVAFAVLRNLPIEWNPTSRNKQG